MTREEALDKAADCLKEAEGSVGEAHWQKQVTLAQLYMTLANETGRIPQMLWTACMNGWRVNCLSRSVRQFALVFTARTVIRLLTWLLNLIRGKYEIRRRWSFVR